MQTAEDLDYRRFLSSHLDDSQYDCALLDGETAAAVGEALMRLKVAMNLCMVTLDDPTAVRGLLRAAAGQAETAATVLNQWREGCAEQQGRQALRSAQ